MNEPQRLGPSPVRTILTHAMRPVLVIRAQLGRRIQPPVGRRAKAGLVVLLLVATLLPFIPLAHAGPLDNPTISSVGTAGGPPNPYAGEIGHYKFTFTLKSTSTWPSNGQYWVDFPAGFGFRTGGTSPTSVTDFACDTCPTAAGTVTLSLQGSRAVLTRTAGSLPIPGSNTVRFTLLSINNPTQPAKYGPFEGSTRDVLGNPIDTGQHVRSGTEPLIEIFARITNPSVQAEYPKPGTATRYTFLFTTTTAMPADADVVIVFPNGYVVSSTATASLQDCDGDIGSITWDGATRRLTLARNAPETCDPGPKTLTVQGVTNPTTTGNTGTFTFTTTTGGDQPVIRDHAEGIPGVFISPALTGFTHAAQPTVSSDGALKTGRPARHIIEFRPATAWPAQGRLVLAFPAGFDATGTVATSTTSCVGPLSVQSAGNSVTILRAAGTSCAAGDTVAIEVDGVKNPASAGSLCNSCADKYGSLVVSTRDASGNFLDILDPADPPVAISVLRWGQLTPASGGIPMVSATSIKAGDVTTYHLRFVLQTDWPSTGRLLVAFPAVAGEVAPYVLGGLTVTAERCGGGFAPSVQGLTVTIARDGTAAACNGDVEFHITSVRNPGVAATLTGFRLLTTDAASVEHDANDPGSTGLTLQPNLLSNVQVTRNNDQAGKSAQHDFRFTTVNPWPATGRLVIQLPDAYGSPPPVGAVSIPACTGTFAPTLNVRELTIQRSGGSQCAAGAKAVTVASLRNPSVAGVSDPFTFTLYDSVGRIIDQNTNVPGVTTLAEGVLTDVSMTPASPVAGQTTNYAVSFSSPGGLKNTDSIILQFPARYDSPVTVGSAVSGTCAASGSTQTFTATATVSVRTVTIARSGGAQCDAGAVALTLGGVKNAPVSGPTGAFNLFTRDQSGVDKEGASLPGPTLQPATIPSSTLSVVAADNDAGDTSDYTFGFRLVNPWPADGKLRLEFPEGYQVSGAQFKALSPCGGDLSPIADPTNRILTLTRGLASDCAADTQVAVTLGGIKNPAASGPTAPFALQTLASTEAPIDVAETIPGIAIDPIGQTLTGLQITAQDPRAGAVTTYTIAFTTATNWPSDGQLAIRFPSGNFLVVTNLQSVTGAGATGTFQLATSGSTALIQRAGGSSWGPGAKQVAFTGVKNPAISGATPPFYVATRTAAGVDLDSIWSGPSTIVAIQPGALTEVFVSPSSSTVGDTGDYGFDFTTTNPWPADGKLLIAFPDGYDLASAGAGALSPCDGTLTAVTNLATRQITLTRSGSTTVCMAGAKSAQITGVKNPSASGPTGTFALRTTDASLVTIDQATGVDGVPLATSATLVVASITPSNTIAGGLGTYRFDFATSVDWSADGRFVVLFPAGYDLGGLSSTADGAGIGVSGSFTAQVASASPPRVLVNRGGSSTVWPADADQVKTITLFGVRNPTVSGSTGKFHLATQTSSGADLESSGLTPGPILQPGPLGGAAITVSDPRASAVTDYGFSFTTTNPWPGDGRLVITFPAGYDLTGVSLGAFTGCAGSFAANNDPVALRVTVTRSSGSTVCVAGAKNLQLAGIKNPGSSGPTDNFKLYTTQSDARLIDANEAVPGVTVTAQGSLTSISITPDDNAAGVLTNYRFSFKTQTDWPTDGRLIITFPPGYGFGSVGATAEGIGVTGAFAALTQPATSDVPPRIVVSRSGTSAQTWPAGTNPKTVVLTNIRNPPVSGDPGSFRLATQNAADTDLDAALDGLDQPLAAAALGAVSIQADDPTAGVLTSYTFRFTTNNPWPADGRLRIVFPSTPAIFGSNQLQPTATASGIGMSGSFLAVKSGSTVTVSRGGPSTGATEWGPGAKTLTLHGVRNPSLSGTSGAFVLETLDGANRAIDAHKLATLDILAGGLDVIQLQPAQAIVGALTNYQLQFRTANAWPASSTLRIDFPLTYPVATLSSSASGSCASGTGTSTITASVASQDLNPGLRVVATLPGSVSCDAGTINLLLQGIKNPNRAGEHGGFVLETRTAAGATIDRSTASPTVTLTPLGDRLADVSVTPASRTVGATTLYTFGFRTSNGWPSNGTLVIEFPTGIDLTHAKLGSITDESGASPSGVTALGLSGRTATITWTNAKADWPPGVKTLKIKDVRNPLQSGDSPAFYLATRGTDGRDVDYHDAATAGFDAATLIDLATSAADLEAGATTSYTFQFRTINPWPADGQFILLFPPGYGFGAVTVASNGDCKSGTFGVQSIPTGPTRVIVTRNGGPTCVNAAQKVVLGGIINPSISGTTGTFAGRTATATDDAIDTGVFPAVTLTAPPDKVEPTAVGAFTSTDFPAAPAWSRVTAGTISWAPATDPGGTGTIRYSWAVDAVPSFAPAEAKTGTMATLSGLTEGVHSFSVRAIDEAGNAGTARSHPFQVDATPPTPAIISSTTHPKDVCNTATTGTFTWSSGSDAGSGLKAPNPYAYKLDSAATAPTSSTSITLTGLTDGLRTLTLTTTDQAGNTATNTYAFKVDVGPPTVTLTGPSVTARSFNVEWMGTDSCSSVASYVIEYRKDGGPSFTTLSAGAATQAAFTPSQGDGYYEFRGRAADQLGNQGSFPATPQLRVLVDATPPAAVESLVARGGLGGAIDVTWAPASDGTGSGIDAYEVYRATDPAGVFEKITTSPVKATSFRDLSSRTTDGTTYYYKVRALDKAGNEGGDSTVASATASHGLRSLEVDAATRARLSTILGTPISGGLVISDQNQDGRIDTLVDPSGQLRLVRTASVGQQEALLVSRGAERAKALWMPASGTVVSIAPQEGKVEKAESVANGTLVTLRTQKEAGWIEIALDDPYPSRTLLRVSAADGRLIPTAQVAREGGSIFILDDPDVTYQLLFEAAGAAKTDGTGPQTSRLAWILGALGVLAAGALSAVGVWYARRRKTVRAAEPQEAGADATPTPPEAMTMAAPIDAYSEAASLPEPEPYPEPPASLPEVVEPPPPAAPAPPPSDSVHARPATAKSQTRARKSRTRPGAPRLVIARKTTPKNGKKSR